MSDTESSNRTSQSVEKQGTRESGSAGPSTVITVDQRIGSSSGSLSGVSIGTLEGNLILMETARARRDFAPPAPVRRFVGRERELQRVVNELRMGKTVLMHGLGGIGKTALARAAGAQLDTADAFENRILWLDDLGAAPADVICDTIASLLGDEQIGKLPPPAKRPATRALLAAHPGHLLVLDYIASAAAAETMLQQIVPAGLAVLVTSRQRLESFDVDIRLNALRDHEAIRLFSLVSGIDGPDERIARICTILEYHPLAIVIAAGRVAHHGLSLDDVVAGLDVKRRLKTLSGLAASLRLSYDTLTSEQQHVFTRLAACFGRSTRLKLLAEVAGLDPIDCVDIVGELFAHSLVARKDELLTMPRLVQDFGRSVLGEELDSVQAQVLSAVERLVETHSGDHPDDHAAVEAELDNVLGASRYALERFPCDRGLMLARELTWPQSGVLGRRGYWSELVAVGSVGMQTAGTCKNDTAWARLAFNTAITLHRRGEYEDAEPLYQQSAALFKRDGDQLAHAAVLHSLGMLAMHRGFYTTAQAHFEASLVIKEQLPAKPSLARTLNELGRLAALQGNFVEAQRYLAESAVHRDSVKDALGTALDSYALALIAERKGELANADGLLAQCYPVFVQHNAVAERAAAERLSGNLARARGRFTEAVERYAQSLERDEQLGNRAGVAATHYEEGRLAIMQDDLAPAATLLRESLAIRQALGDQAGIADVLHEQGRLALAEGNLARAAELLSEGLTIYQQLPDHVGVTETLREQGRLALAQGNVEAARRLLQESLERSTALGLLLGLARAQYELCRLVEVAGDVAEARERCAESLRLFEQIGAVEAEQARQALARIEAIAR